MQPTNMSLRRDRRPALLRLALRNPLELFGFDDLISMMVIFFAGAFLLNFLGDWVEGQPVASLDMVVEERLGETADSPAMR